MSPTRFSSQIVSPFGSLNLALRYCDAATSCARGRRSTRSHEKTHQHIRQTEWHNARIGSLLAAGEDTPPGGREP